MWFGCALLCGDSVLWVHWRSVICLSSNMEHVVAKSSSSLVWIKDWYDGTTNSPLDKLRLGRSTA